MDLKNKRGDVCITYLVFSTKDLYLIVCKISNVEG